MSQDLENWGLLQELFHLAEETAAEERERVLGERCADTAMVRRALEIFEGSTVSESGRVAPAPILQGRVGSYTLLRLIGSGGIGSVYLAERMVGGAPQRFALKMLAPHAAGASFVDRFHREQHILGSLDHANITRMIDAGLTEAGQPYLVMEYVDGEHLDAYCDSRKLGIEERLRLFLHVCDAVAYAHRNLIVHLDLKPSNVLVSKDGTIKLLDFGTSKLIQTDSLFTTTVMATPAYASPEQLRNEPVTTACDVYTLGAILFELLCGRRPYAHVSIPAMMEHAMKDHAPEKLSEAVTEQGAARRGLSKDKLRQELHGDLETIANKCLRPLAVDRYVSVDALMQDVVRYREGMPVLARPQTTIYRLSKFMQRNRKAVAMIAAALVLLVAALGYAEVKQRRALEEGRRAEQMQGFMYRLLRLANSDSNGQHDATVTDFLHLGVRILPQYIQDPSDLRAAQLSLARSLAENDVFDDAEVLYTEANASAIKYGDINAEADAETHLGEAAYVHGDAKNGAALTAHALQLSRSSKVTPLVRADCDTFYAFYRDNLGFRTDENLRLLKEAVDLERKSNQPPTELANTIRMLADDYVDRSDPAHAEPYLMDAMKVYGNDPALLCGRAATEDGLAWVKGQRGDMNGAIEEQRLSYEDITQCAGPNSHQASYAATYLADHLLKAGRIQEALVLMEQTIPWERKLVGDSTDFADSLRIVSKAYLKAGRLPEAEAAVKEAIAIRARQSAPTHPVMGALDLLYAEILAGEHRYPEALPQAEAAKRILSAAAVEAPTLRSYVVECDQTLGEIEAHLGVETRKPLS
jgi:serine/threonine protein kinase